MATRHCCPQQQAAAAGMLQQRPRCSWRRPRAGTALTPCHTSAPRRVPWLSAPPAHSRAAVAALQFAFQRRRQLCRNPGAAPPAALNINACPTLRGGTCRGRPSAPGPPPRPSLAGQLPRPPQGLCQKVRGGCGGASCAPHPSGEEQSEGGGQVGAAGHGEQPGVLPAPSPPAEAWGSQEALSSSPPLMPQLRPCSSLHRCQAAVGRGPRSPLPWAAAKSPEPKSSGD